MARAKTRTTSRSASRTTKQDQGPRGDLLAHFGLRAMPFTREIRTRDHFPVEEHEVAKKALLQEVQRRGSGALDGPAGCGKTALSRSFIDELPEARYKVYYLLAGDLGVRDACRVISQELGVEPSGSRPTLLRRVKEALLRNPDERGVHPVLLFDDAHEIKLEVLSLVKSITNFDMDSRLVVSVLLVGQPKLRTLLRRVELEDVAGRLGVHASLGNLSREAALRYVEHRITVAGGRRVPFETTALEALYELAGGNLRALDTVALRSLELAYVEGDEVVDAAHVQAAGRWICA